MGNTNPLAGHFRQPAIYLKLPSQGRYWPEGAIDLPLTGEIPVYPMTSKDEVTLKTPDALLNGQGVVDVIQSCCPSIKDAWQMPNTESDAVLIAIRLASYGNEMGVDSKCPHCNHDNSHAIDLNIVLDRVRFPNYDKIIEAGGLKFKLKPHNYYTANKANLAAFEEQKIMENLLIEGLEEEEKLAEFNHRIKNLNTLNIDMIVGFTDYIEIPTGEKVRDEAFIKEFYDNADNKIIKVLQAAVQEINGESELPTLKISCEGCEKEYDLKIEFDHSRFFGNS